MSLFQSCFALIESDACETADCAIQLLIMESYPSTSKKRFTGFNDKWITDPDFKEWIEKKNEFTAICKACNSDIAIQYEGRRALADCNGDGRIDCYDYMAIHKKGGYGCVGELPFSYVNVFNQCVAAVAGAQGQGPHYG